MPIENWEETTDHHMEAATTRAAALIHTRPSNLTTDAALAAVLFEGVPVVEGAEDSVEGEESSVLEKLEAGAFVGTDGRADVATTGADV